MNTEMLMQYITYALGGIGILAFLVSVVVQVIKEMPVLKKIQTNVVALAVSLILTPVAVVVLCISYGDGLRTWGGRIKRGGGKENICSKRTSIR